MNAVFLVCYGFCFFVFGWVAGRCWDSRSAALASKATAKRLLGEARPMVRAYAKHSKRWMHLVEYYDMILRYMSHATNDERRQAVYDALREAVANGVLRAKDGYFCDAAVTIHTPDPFRFVHEKE